MQTNLRDQIWSYQPNIEETEYKLLPKEFRKLLNLLDVPEEVIKSIIRASEIERIKRVQHPFCTK